jgi:hypothetical protein
MECNGCATAAGEYQRAPNGYTGLNPTMVGEVGYVSTSGLSTYIGKVADVLKTDLQRTQDKYAPVLNKLKDTYQQAKSFLAPERNPTLNPTYAHH